MILDGHVTGLFSGKEKQLRCIRLAPKGKGILMGVPACVQKRISAGRPGMTQECKGETVQMPEAFGIKSGKSPNFGRINQRDAWRMEMNKTSETVGCYQCGLAASASFTIPPLCMVPEEDEFQINFKKHLLSIPSCQSHILFDTLDEHYFQKVVRSVVWNNVFAYFRNKVANRLLDSVIDPVVSPEFNFSTASCNVDLALLLRYTSNLAKAIYHHEHGQIFSGRISDFTTGFLEYFEPANVMLKSCFDHLADKYPRKGKDKQLFFYQLAQATEVLSQFQSADLYQRGGQFLRLTFYEESNFFLILEQNGQGQNSTSKGSPISL